MLLLKNSWHKFYVSITIFKMNKIRAQICSVVHHVRILLEQVLDVVSEYPVWYSGVAQVLQVDADEQMAQFAAHTIVQNKNIVFSCTLALQLIQT